MSTHRLTCAQAIVEFLINQHTERDGKSQRLFGGCFGVFGHGNVAGMGEALAGAKDRLRYYQVRNEQAMVHSAAAYARMRNRLATFACTSSVGPGATNMVTGAAGATINRLPVLLLPGDTFTSRSASPVLQELEVASCPDVSVNDCLRPVSRYWDRINTPQQLINSLPAAMRVLTDPAETGAVTLALPEDLQTFAYDFPIGLFERREWRVPRPVPEPELVARAASLIRRSLRPLIVAGGGVIYSEATDALRELVDVTGIPVAETQAGKGSLPFGHSSALGAIGVTGTPGANEIAGSADLVIGVGTRWSDFTTASHTVFSNSHVQFININIGAFDAAKHSGLSVVADARTALEALAYTLSGFVVGSEYRDTVREHVRAWDREVTRMYQIGHVPLPSQAEVIGAVNAAAQPRDVVVSAAGSLPGQLHQMWRARDPKGYHVEYGFSCMGYEIAGGLGVKMAAPDREIFVLVGDGSYLMMANEIVTSVQEHLKLVIVLIQNHGYASITALSESLGSGGFGTQYRYRDANGQLDGEQLPVDLAANAASLGALVVCAQGIADLVQALRTARASEITTVIYIETDPSVSTPGYAWWEVPVAEVSGSEAVRRARAAYEKRRLSQRLYL